MSKVFHHPARLALAGGLVVLATMIAPSAASAQSYWFENYERAVDLIDQGRIEQAAPLLEEVLKLHPIPISGLRVPGDRSIEYQPYFQRARLLLRAGDLPGAIENLEISEAYGAPQASPRVRRDHIRLREEIAALRAERMRGGGAAGRR